MANSGRAGTCDVCGKPKKLSQIDSGQFLCPSCLAELKPPRPKHLASYATIAAFARRGVTLPDGTTREEAKRIKEDAGFIAYLLGNIWYEHQGQSAFRSSVSLEGLSLEIVLEHPDLARRTAALERSRQDAALKRYRELVEINKPRKITDPVEGCYFAGDQLYDAATSRPLSHWDFKPPLIRGADYETLVQLIWGPER